jgi:hypothetical protein
MFRQSRAARLTGAPSIARALFERNLNRLFCFAFSEVNTSARVDIDGPGLPRRDIVSGARRNQFRALIFVSR